MPRKLLLHTCCAPCLSQCLSVLSGRDGWKNALQAAPDFSVTVFYDNPNIFPAGEFSKRKDEVMKLLDIYSKDLDVDILKDDSEQRRAGWETLTEKYPDEPEKGVRCALCYEFRLAETFRKAGELKFDAVATTLTLSPLKHTVKINEIGSGLSEGSGLSYIKSDFKKNDGFKKSIELSGQFHLYRQNYCGCRYSIR
jgi:epoxyqueuosine reductase